MKRVTDIGIIIASLILSAGFMFAFDKELTAWLFVLFAVLGFFKFVKIIEFPKTVVSTNIQNVVPPPATPITGYQPTSGNQPPTTNP